MRRPRPQVKFWIKPKEFNKFLNLVIWITGAYEHKSDLKLLKDRYHRLWKRSGSNFTFLYLKECLKLCIQSLAGNPQLEYSKGICVARDDHGLPLIIPYNLRLFFVNKDWKMVRVILTVLSIFRVFPTTPKISLSTILDPFTGVVQSFDQHLLRRALGELCTGMVLPSIKLVKLETSSPDSVKACFGSSNAIMALWSRPISIYYLFRLNSSFKSLILLSYVCFVMLLALPFALIGLICKVDFALGSLSIVYDQAGKARVVAMTNWIYQVYLYPIHKAIFSILKNIEMDGTFDQLLPLRKLLDNGSSEKFYCFDLSAATDRLPIQIQIDILNILKKDLGSWWGKLLSIRWLFKKKYYSYTVGQPMGAYSSWAMLALTHHVIVKMASLRVGLNGFKDYCILGDDLVIRNEAVAKEYMVLMSLLGVSINLSKSVISKYFCEFAKVYEGDNGIAFTPIGSGLILRTIRNRNFIGTLLSETFKIKLYKSLADVVKVLVHGRKVMNITVSDHFLGIWSCIGFGGALYKIRPADEKFVRNSIAWCFASKHAESAMIRFQVYNAMLQLKIDSYHDTYFKLKSETWYMCSNIHQLSGRSWPFRAFELFTKFISLGVWVYIINIIIDWYKFAKEVYNVSQWYDDTASFDAITKLALSDQFNVTSIDWTNVKLIKQSAKRVKSIKRLVKSIEVNIDLLETSTMRLDPCYKEQMILKGKAKPKAWGMYSYFLPK
nr:MAG: putative RNA dependent RNA polymerase [Guangxi sediment mito-like virus 1]